MVKYKWHTLQCDTTQVAYLSDTVWYTMSDLPHMAQNKCHTLQYGTVWAAYPTVWYKTSGTHYSMAK